MTGPVLFLALPLVAAALVYVFRRWRGLSTLLAVGTCLLLGMVLIFAPFDEPITVLGREILLGETTSFLGRELVLDSSIRAAMAFLFLTGAGLFLLGWQLDKDLLFAPVGLGVLGLLTGALLVRPLIYAALLLQIAASLTIFALHANPRSSVRGGLRYLTFVTLALPGLMASHWLLDMYAVTPDQLSFLYGATVLIGFSFALLLGVVPFHPWMPTVGRDGAPLASAFLFSAHGGTVWFLFLDYLQTYPWLTDYPQWSMVLSLLGVLTAVAGGLLAMARREPGRLMGYAMMVDTGLLLAALAQSSRTGVGLAVAILFARPWGMALAAAGLSGLRLRGEEIGAGLGLRAPWSTIALVVGGLSLAGFPPTVGFVPRWGLYRLLFRTQPTAALILLLASTGSLVGLLRQLYLLIRRPHKVLGAGEEAPEDAPPASPEPLILVVLLFIFIVGTIGFGIFPQGLMNAAARVGESFAIFSP